ncbi:DUF6455 family protein [Pararhodobacter sp.]
MFGWIARSDRHSALFSRMARIVGVDLARDLEKGIGHADSLRSLMIRCTDCQNADACQSWLDRHADGAAVPPDFCLNRKALQEKR